MSCTHNKSIHFEMSSYSFHRSQTSCLNLARTEEAHTQKKSNHYSHKQILVTLLLQFPLSSHAHSRTAGRAWFWKGKNYWSNHRDRKERKYLDWKESLRFGFVHCWIALLSLVQSKRWPEVNFLIVSCKYILQLQKKLKTR